MQPTSASDRCTHGSWWLTKWRVCSTQTCKAHNLTLLKKFIELYGNNNSNSKRCCFFVWFEYISPSTNSMLCCYCRFAALPRFYYCGKVRTTRFFHRFLLSFHILRCRWAIRNELVSAKSLHYALCLCKCWWWFLTFVLLTISPLNNMSCLPSSFHFAFARCLFHTHTFIFTRCSV